MDTLTGQYNRFKTEQILLNEFDRFKRYGENIGVIMLDIDKFKDVNDTFGHNCGDEVLTELCSLVSKNLRRVDVFGRWGGEEFVVICPGTSLESGAKIADNLRSRVEAHSFTPVPKVTVSLGVSAFQRNEHAYSDALKRADVALYESKRTGRNRVCSRSDDKKSFCCIFAPRRAMFMGCSSRPVNGGQLGRPVNGAWWAIYSICFYLVPDRKP